MTGFILFALLRCSLALGAPLSGDVDLRPFYPAIRNQHDVGNCYAQTAADLETADYWKRGEKRDQFVSPDAISVCTKAKDLQETFQGAVHARLPTQTPQFQASKEVLKKVIKEWDQFPFPHHPPTPEDKLDPKYVAYGRKITLLCKSLFYTDDAECFRDVISEAGFKQENSPAFASGTSVDNSGILEAIQQANQKCGVCFQKSFGENDNLLIHQFDRQIGQYAHGMDLSRFESCSGSSTLPPENLRAFNKIIQKLQAGTLKEHPALALFEKKCKLDARAKYFVDHAQRDVLSADKFKEVERVSKLLDQKIPLGIAYDAGILDGDEPSSTPNHASSLVGKRTVEGKLYFILRNSWGKEDCSQRQARLKNPAYFCDEGDFVVEAASLMNGSESITYFQ